MYPKNTVSLYADVIILKTAFDDNFIIKEAADSNALIDYFKSK